MSRPHRLTSIAATIAIVGSSLIATASPAAADTPTIQLEETVIAGSPPVESTAATVQSGEEFSLLLKYRCASTAPCAGGSISTVLPQEVEFLSAPVPSDVASWTNDGGQQYPVGSSHQHQGGHHLVFTMEDPLSGGATGQIQIKVRFPDWWTPNNTTVSHNTTFAATNATPVLSNTVSATSQASSSVTLSKSLMSGAVVDDYTAYRISACVSNSTQYGHLGLVDLELTDQLPADSEFYGASDGGVESASGVVTWAIPDFAWYGCTERRVWVRFPSTFAANVVGASKVNNATWRGRRVGEPSVTQLATASASHLISDPVQQSSISKWVSSPRTDYTQPVPAEAWYNESVTYSISGQVGGNVTSTNTVISDPIPAAFRTESINVAASELTTGEVWIRSLDDPTWRLAGAIGQGVSWSAYLYGPMLPSGTPGLTSTDWLTDLEVRSSFMLPMSNFYVWMNGQPRTIDRNGTAVAPLDIVSNTATITTLQGGVTTTNSSTSVFAVRKTVQPVYLALWASPSTYQVDPVVRTVTYSLNATSWGGETGLVNDPVVYDLLPAGASLSSWNWSFGTDPTPIVDQTPNYHGTGRTLVRVTWPSGTMLRPNQYLNLSLNVHFGASTWGIVHNDLQIAADSVATPYLCAINVAPDVNDIDGDTDTTESVCSTWDLAVEIAGVASARIGKEAQGTMDQTMVSSPAMAATGAGDTTHFELPVTNSGSVPLDNVTVIDVLPTASDTNVMNDTPRNIASFVPVMAASPTAPPGSVISYSTSTNPCRVELDYNPVGCSPPAWSTTPPPSWNSLTAIKIEFGSQQLNPGETWTTTFDMLVPAGTPVGSRTWNSAAFWSRRIDLASELIPSESRTMGIRVPLGDGQLGGIVTQDHNGNGVVDVGEIPKESALVNLWGTGPDAALGTSDDELISNTLAGPDGEYRFTAVDPGQYRIVVDTSSLGGDTVAMSDADSMPDASTDVTVTYGTARSDLNFGFTSRRIGNFVWEDLNLNGVQDVGEPGVDGATVMLRSAGSVVGTMLSGDNPSTPDVEHGWYQFDSLPVGSKYDVGIAAPAGMFATYANAGSDDSVDSDIDPQSKFTTTSYELSDALPSLDHVDIGLVRQSQLGRISGRSWEDSDGDGVQDSSEPPLANSGFYLFRQGSDGIWGTSDDSSSYTSTPASGTYAFEGLLPGNYRVQMAPPWPLVLTVANAGPDDSIDSDLSTIDHQSDELAIVAGSDLIVDGGATRSAVIDLWSFEDTNHDGVRSSGEPPSPISPWATSPGPDGVFDTADDVQVSSVWSGGPSAGSMALSPGTYRFCSQPTITWPSERHMVVKDQGSDDTVDSDADPTTGCTDPVTLAPGDATSVDFGYEPGTNSISGTLWLDSNSDGIQDLGEPKLDQKWVTLYNIGADAQYGTGDDRWMGNAMTDSTGAYAFTGIFDGNYMVVPNWPDSPYRWTASDQGTDDSADSDIDPSTSRSTPVALTGSTSAVMDGGWRLPDMIGDIVWNDQNANGIQDPGEPGLGNVLLRLRSDGPDGYAGTPDDVNLSAWSQWDGSYYFADPPAGATYWLEVGQVSSTSSGLMSPTANDQGTDDGLDSDIDPATGRSALFVFSAGDHQRSWDVGLLPGTNSLNGHVWEDTNKDGLRDTGEPAVAWTWLTLYGAGLDGLTGTADDMWLASTSTDADGRYEFLGLPAGNYFVQMPWPQGGSVITAKDVGTDELVDSDTNPDSRTDVIHISGSTQTANADAGWARASVLGDRVWDDANGSGTQDPGEPGLSGVRVHLGSPGPDGVAGTGDDYSFDTWTDGLGNYECKIPNVNQNYAISVAPIAAVGASFYQLVAPNSGTDDTIDSDIDSVSGQSQVLNGVALDSLDLDIGYRRGTASVGDFVWQDDNQNGLQDSGESGRAGISLALHYIGADGIDYTADDSEAYTTTDSTGKYEFVGVPAGRYFISIQTGSGDYLTLAHMGTDPAVDSDPDGGSGWGRTATLTIGSGDHLSDIDAGVVVPPAIFGTAWLDANGDGIHDNSEITLANTPIHLLEPGDDGVFDTADDRVTWTTSTDGGGNYRFTGPPPGNYRIRTGTTVSGSILVNWNWQTRFFRLTTQGAGSDPTMDSDIDPTTGMSATFAFDTTSYRLDVGAVSGTDSISGRVWSDTNVNGIQDAGEPPVMNGSVSLSSAGVDGVFGTADDSVSAIWGSTDPTSGTYVFDNLPTGTYRVAVSSEGPATRPNVGADDSVDSDFVWENGWYSGPIVSNAGIATDAGIIPTAKITGRTWEDSDADGIDTGETEPGVGDVSVRIVGPGWDGVNGTSDDYTEVQRSGSGGSYIFDRDLIPGTYTVSTGSVAIGQGPGGMSAYQITLQDQGSDDHVDSDATPATGTLTTSATVGMKSGDNDFGLVLGNSSLQGHLWMDDFDGVRESGEPAGSGIELELWAPGPDGIWNTNDDGRIKATSDSNGDYIFKDIAPGTYRIQIDSHSLSFSPRHVGSDTTVDSDVDASGMTDDIVVPAATAVANIDAGVFTPGNMSGRVWNDLNYNGIQDPSEPGIPGIRVDLAIWGPDEIWGTADDKSGSLFTDASGVWDIGPFPTSILRVTINTTGTSWFRVAQDQGTDDAVDSDLNQTTGTSDLPHGMADLRVDAGLHDGPIPAPELSEVQGLAFVDINQDSVYEPGEGLLPGVSVELLPGGTPLGALVSTSGAAAIISTTTTGSDGRFIFNPVPVGDYQVRIVGGVPAGLVLRADSQGAADGDVATTASTGTPGAAWFAYDGKSAISSFIFDDANANGVRDSDESGLGGISVTLTGPFGIRMTVETSATGKLYVPNLPFGDWSLEVATSMTPTADTDGVLDNETAIKLASTSMSITEFGYGPTPASTSTTTTSTTAPPTTAGPVARVPDTTSTTGATEVASLNNSSTPSTAPPDLAFTGSNLMMLLGVGIVLAVLGSSIRRTRRRR